MVATFWFAEANGSPTTGSLLWNGATGSVANINMGSIDSAELTAATYPIIAGENSYEKWFAGSWSGTFTQIDNLQFWMSAGSYGTGEVIKWTGSGVDKNMDVDQTGPTTTTSTFAVGSVPSADPGTANVGLGSPPNLSGTLTATGSSNFIVLQYQTTASASPGPTNQKTFTLQWDEQ